VKFAGFTATSTVFPVMVTPDDGTVIAIDGMAIDICC
jgi:hypothetical protein